MTTLKELIYKILLDKPETRDSDKKLIWEVWKKSGFVVLDESEQNYTEYYRIEEEDFMKAPSPESIRRCRQSLQRSDLLTGTKLIQPTPKVKEKRVKLSKEKGASYMMGKEHVWEFDRDTNTFREI